MGFFGDLLSGVSNFFAKHGQNITNAASLAYDIKKDQSLTGAQREANAFNSAEAAAARSFQASEAEKNRLFQSAEADIARQWQEEQYLKYNSPEAMIRQYQDAGLNPALMYENAAGASASTSTQIPSGSMPGGAVASSVAPTQNLQMLSAIMGMRKTAAEIENIKKDTEYKGEQTKLTKEQIDKVTAEVGKLVEDTNLVKKTIEETDANISLIKAQSSVQAALKSLHEAEKKGIDASTWYKEWENSYIDENDETREQTIQRRAAWINGGALVLSSLVRALGSLGSAKIDAAGKVAKALQTGETKTTTTYTVDPATGEVLEMLTKIEEMAKSAMNGNLP